MIVVRIKAGLGNQMFQYALYRRLQVEGKEVYIDTSAYSSKPIHNNFELGSIFDIQPMKAKPKQINKVRRYSCEINVYQRIFRKTRLFLGKPYRHYIEKELYNYDDNIFNLKNDYYLDGYWQTHRYFEPIKDIIRNDFKFKKALDDKNQEYLYKIKNTSSISIHIRRNDFIENPLHDNICTPHYYEAALNIIRELIDTPSYYIFSDDLGWCKNNFRIKDALYIEGNSNRESYKDMELMAACQHNIIANSSFSWWAAWLNDNMRKIIITPSRMINKNIDFKDAFPSSWKKVPV